MKAVRIEQTNNTFQPIKIMITIESQVEVDALVKARKELGSDEINEHLYDSATRYIWIKALETLAEGL